MKKSKEEGGILLFGIDFTSVGSIRIRYLEDVNILLNHSNVNVHQTNGAVSVVKDIKGNELAYTTISIEDTKFKKLTIGSKLEKGYKRDYIILDLSVREGGNNLIP